MLFDEKKAIVVDFDKNGKIERALITDDRRDINKMIDFSRVLLKSGMKFSEYLLELSKKSDSSYNLF